MFTLDEAQHLTHVSASLLRYQLETIKSVANLSKALHVMFGTYELLLLRNASGQLGRRALTIHFDRYQANSDQDIVAFAEVVKSFQLQMPLPQTPDFLLRKYFPDVRPLIVERYLAHRREQSIANKTRERERIRLIVRDFSATGTFPSMNAVLDVFPANTLKRGEVWKIIREARNGLV